MGLVPQAHAHRAPRAEVRGRAAPLASIAGHVGWGVEKAMAAGARAVAWRWKQDQALSEQTLAR